MDHTEHTTGIGSLRMAALALLVGVLLVVSGPAQAAMVRCEVYPCPEEESEFCSDHCPGEAPVVIDTPCVRWTIVGGSWGAQTEITGEDLGCQ